MFISRPFVLLFIVLSFIQCVLTAVSSPSASGNRVLVIADHPGGKTSPYSIFLGGLEERGFQLTSKNNNDQIELTAFDELLYDHLIVLSTTSSTYEENITVANLIDFVNKGGNILLAASSDIPEILRDFAVEFSADFDDSNTAVFDDFHAVATKDNGNAIYSSNFGEQASYILTPGGHDITKGYKFNPVLFQGVAHRLTGRNSLILPVLSGSATAYSLDTRSQKVVVDPSSPFVASKVALVSALQARSNARIVFCGSALLFSDEFANTQVKTNDGTFVASGNKDFAFEVGKWVFQEKRVLQISGSRHHREGETQQHGVYRITDKMVFEMKVREFYDGKWNQFHATDIQFEAVMLDPYIRQTMIQAKGGNEDVSGTKYLAFFKLPDHHGVFKFRVDYKRHGLSWAYVDDLVEVRPFRHDQYPRFMTVAFPYYANVFSMIFGFLLISALWLFHRDAPSKTEKNKVKKN